MTGPLWKPRPRLAIASQKPPPLPEYYTRVQGTEAASLIGYWPLWDASGANAEELQSLPVGTYTGVTLGSAGIGDGRTCPEFDGVNDYCNVYTAELNAAFNGDEGTAMIWAKVDGAARWTDSSQDDMFFLCGDNASTCYLSIAKATTNSTIAFKRWVDVGYFKTINKSTSSTSWMHLAITWSVAADYFKAWYNGELVDTALGLGTWNAPMLATFNVVGAGSTGPTNGFDGWLAHFAIWTKPLGASDIYYLSAV